MVCQTSGDSREVQQENLVRRSDRETEEALDNCSAARETTTETHMEEVKKKTLTRRSGHSACKNATIEQA